MVDLHLAAAASPGPPPAGTSRPPGTRSIAVAQASSGIGAERVGEVGASRRAAGRGSPRVGAAASVLDVGVAGLLGGVHRDRLAVDDAAERAGEALGVEGEVGHHVGAGPAGQHRWARPQSSSVEAVDGADQPAGRVGQQRSAAASRRVGHGPILPVRVTEFSLSVARDDRGRRRSRTRCRGDLFGHRRMTNTCSKPRGLQWPTSSSSAAPASTTSRTSRSTCPRDSLIVFTGLSGSGKSSPGVRHDLRRGPAPLRRVAVGVRPPVPRPDGQARRRLHRGPVAGGLDRPEVHLEEPALDGRHDHRGLRLPPPALRPRRPAALPDLRRADRAADPAADRRPDPRAARRAAASRCSRRSSAAARASTSSCSASCRPRASPGPGSTARPTRSTSRPSSTSRRSTRSRSSSTGSRSRSPRSGGSPTRSRPRCSLAGGLVLFDFVDLPTRTRTASCGSPSSWPAPTTTRSTSTSSSRARSRSTRPFGACPECHGLGTRMEVDPELVVPDPQATLGEGAIQPWSQAHVADYFLRLLGALGDELGFDLDTPWEDLAAEGAAVAARRPPDQGARALHATATAASAPTTPSSRACAPTSSAGTARPSPTPAASGSRASCARCRARPAAAAGSSRSSWRSRSARETAARTSPRSARCRSARPPTSCATSS